jgi:ABC-type sugar transport system substrate-binding protein
MKKIVVTIAILLLASMPLIAGGQEEGAAATGPKQPEDMQVVLIVKDLTNPFFVDMKDGGAAAAKKWGMQYTCLAPEKYSVENQIRIMEDLIEKRVDGIVIVPIDGKGIVSGIERANEAGIPIFNCNTRAETDEVLGFAGIDHVKIGEGLGQFAVDYLDGKGRLIILEGTTGASTARDRLEGMHNILDNHPDIEILTSTTAKYNRQMAMQVTEDLLVRFPEVDLVLAANDSMALGAKEAIKDARRDIAVAGADAIPEALDAVESGDLAATIDSSGYIQAYTAVDLLCKYLATGERPPKETKIGTGGAKIIDAANVAEFKAAKQ